MPVEKINFRLIGTTTPAYEDMMALRMKVLLEPIGVSRSYVNPQKEAEDLLIGAYDGETLVGCCILTKVAKDTIQLRQMAVDHAYQGKGIGAAIVAHAESLAKEKGCETLMMHARDNVLSFYQKCGYQVYGEPFFEVGIRHHKMHKRLQPTVK